MLKRLQVDLAGYGNILSDTNQNFKVPFVCKSGDSLTGVILKFLIKGREILYI